MADREASLPSRQSRRVLLVEGRNDRHVVEHVYWKRFDSKPPFAVLDKEGFSRLRDAIGPELKAPEREVVGIIVDANDDLTARWTAVTDRLRTACPGIEIGDPAPEGTIVRSEPRVGIWLWPDNESGGELEDFVAEMVPDDDPVWPLSRCYIQGIPVEHRQFSEGKTARAEIHAWLATRKEPRWMGSAIRTGDLEVDGVLATRFASWIENLFGDGGSRSRRM